MIFLYYNFFLYRYKYFDMVFFLELSNPCHGYSYFQLFYYRPKIWIRNPKRPNAKRDLIITFQDSGSQFLVSTVKSSLNQFQWDTFNMIWKDCKYAISIQQSFSNFFILFLFFQIADILKVANNSFWNRKNNLIN